MSLAKTQRSGCGSVMIAASLKRLTRNGSTASGESGPPRLKRTTAILAMTDLSHEFGDMLGRGLGNDAMAEIEDEGTAAEAMQQPGDALPHRDTAGDEQQRVEIALHRPQPPLHLLRGGVRDGRVEADRGHLRLGEIRGIKPARAARK